jgi:hypothetical protein
MGDDDVYTFKQLAADVLARAVRPLTSVEIWAEAQIQGLDRRLRSIGQTPAATLYADLHRSTQDDDSSVFCRVGSRPRRYWLRSRPVPGTPDPEPKPPAVATVPKQAPLVERDLHPLLAWFADSRMGGLQVKTIYHERSKKKTFGEWVHPDLVGVMFPRRALDNDLALKFAASLSAPLCRVYSFELKLAVDFNNLREAFFQTVSNSSWAHEAYLVSAEYDDSPEFADELERLCQAFGIGTIELSLDEPLSSRIRIPARRKPELDWATIDKLSEMNTDFSEFLKNVADDLRTDIHPKEYDGIPEDPMSYIEKCRTRSA